MTRIRFTLDGRAMAAPLPQVREVVRAVGVQPLTGTRAPVTGVMQLGGRPVPVVDLRSGGEAGGDALVMTAAPESVESDLVVLAVDSVDQVLADDDLTAAEPPGPGMPQYVLGTCRIADTGEVLLLVDLWVLAGLPQT
jgi:chemotaxis signal transduction protein